MAAPSLHNFVFLDSEERHEQASTSFITVFLPSSKWSRLLLRIVLQDALIEVVKNSSQRQKLRHFVDKELLETAEKVLKKLKRKVHKKCLMLSIIEEEKQERAWLLVFGGEVSEMQQKRKSSCGDVF